MKHIYFLWVIVACLGFQVQGSTESIGQVGEAIEGIPSDYKNDLWLNTNYREMSVGDTYSIVARRVPEISSGSSVTLPQFQYEVVAGSSVSVSENGEISALSLGTSIVQVKYTEITSGGTVYGAVSPVNVTYMAVDVIDPSVNTGIEFTSGLELRSYDTYYFTEGTSVNYTFSLTASNSDALAVYCNGEAATQEGDNFTVALENRANIIEVVAENATGTKKLYYVVDVRKIEIQIENITDPLEGVTPGDEVKVSFYGITIPVYKLSTIYNPCLEAWGGEYTRVRFENDVFGTVATNDPNISQYNIADYNSITLTFNEAGSFEFKNGRIYEMWWGSELGAEKDMSGPGNPPLNVPTNEAEFSKFPSFIVDVSTYHFADFEDINLEAESTFSADASEAPLYETVTEELISWSYAFKSYATNWGSMTMNFGFTISNQTDNVSAGGADNQFNSTAGGDIESSGNYAVVYDANSGGLNMGPDYGVEFRTEGQTEDRIISGCYITNNTYAHNVMRDGNGLSTAFGGNDGTVPDWCKITAEGIDSEGNSTGTVDFYLADFQSDYSELDYILEDWMWFDLSSLGAVSKVKLSMTSSDVGTYGMNTPAYYCIDNVDKKRLDVISPLEDVTASVGDETMEISLVDLFADLDDASHEVLKAVVGNTNEEAVSASISGDILSLDFLDEGVATIVIKGKYQGMAITDTFNVEVSPSTHIRQTLTNAIRVYPNPCTDYVSIETTEAVEKIEILSLNGELLLATEQNYLIDLRDLTNGVYLLKVTIKGESSVSRIVKM